MRRLVNLADLALHQHEEVVELLRKGRVRFRETPSNFVDTGAIMVVDEDFAKAQAILRGESRSFAERERKKWEIEWRIEHKNSRARWFLQRIRNHPMGTIGQLVLLIIVFGIFVVYPVWYVVRAAI